MVSFSLTVIIGIISGIVIILVAILAILLRKEKGLHQQLVKVEEKSKYIKRIDELLRSDKSAEMLLNALDQLSKEYFEDKYRINRETDYSEIRAEMLKRGEKEAAEFAQEMVRALYSGKKMKMIFLQENMKKFRELIHPSPLPKERGISEDNSKDMNFEYEDIKGTRARPNLPTYAPEQKITLLKSAKESGEVTFPVINKSAENPDERKEEEAKEKQKEKEWRAAFKKESLAKELPVKLQEELAEDSPKQDPKKIQLKKDKKQTTTIRSIANIPSSLYSHLR